MRLPQPWVVSPLRPPVRARTRLSPLKPNLRVPKPPGGLPPRVYFLHRSRPRWISSVHTRRRMGTRHRAWLQLRERVALLANLAPLRSAVPAVSRQTTALIASIEGAHIVCACCAQSKLELTWVCLASAPVIGRRLHPRQNTRLLDRLRLKLQYASWDLQRTRPAQRICLRMRVIPLLQRLLSLGLRCLVSWSLPKPRTWLPRRC